MTDQPPHQDTEEEVWRPIPDLGGHYEASSLGRIRSARGGKGTYIGKVLTPSRRRYGYLDIELRLKDPARCRRRRHFTVQSLVAAAFIGPRPQGMQVDHIDFDPSNNRPENLRYLTISENVARSFRAGRSSNVGEKNPRARLTCEEVQEIRRAPCGLMALATKYERHLPDPDWPDETTPARSEPEE